MMSNGGDSSEIFRELEELKLKKADIEHRILTLEAKLQDTAAVERYDTVSNGDTYPTAPELKHGLSPDQIYRYSRQLLLPSFAVEGTFAQTLKCKLFPRLNLTNRKIIRDG